MAVRALVELTVSRRVLQLWIGRPRLCRRWLRCRKFFGVLFSIGGLRARLGTPSAEYELASQTFAFQRAGIVCRHHYAWSSNHDALASRIPFLKL